MIRGRWLWISIAGIATALLVIWPDSSNDDESVAASKKRETASTRQSAQSSNEGRSPRKISITESIETLKLENLVREKSAVDKTNPFAKSSWYQAPPPPKVSAPALPPVPVEVPAATAPPMPLSYMGSYEDGAKRLVLLLKGSQMYTVSEGDTIDNLYRIESIEGNKVDIVYLPLGITQIIDTGEKAFSARKKGK